MWNLIEWFGKDGIEVEVEVEDGEGIACSRR